MLKRLFEKCLLQPRDLTPSQPGFEVIGVFNPGAVRTAASGVALMARVAEKPAGAADGEILLPRFEPGNGMCVDRVSVEDWEYVDPRMVRNKTSGLVRLTFISHLRLFQSHDGRNFEPAHTAILRPEAHMEEFGIEDPRITPLGDQFAITYVAVSRHGAATALLLTRDFRSFDRKGIILYPENKDVVLFPEKIAGQYTTLHRPNAATPFTRPEIWIAQSPDRIHWGHHEILHGGTAEWDSGRIGAGAPPFRVPEGWLEIYHGNRKPQKPGEVGPYAAGLLLLQPDNPARIIGRAPDPIMAPEAPFEKNGFVADVVFPTAIVEEKETVLIYYGAADTCTAVVEFAKDDLRNAIV
jgi:beta-1,2-mannobiose phosphorylase / 1,2-beta-oligomannan phosphorylase